MCFLSHAGDSTHAVWFGMVLCDRMKQTCTKIIVVTKLPDENTGVPTSSPDCSRNYSLALKTGSIVDVNYRITTETNA